MFEHSWMWLALGCDQEISLPILRPTRLLVAGEVAGTLVWTAPEVTQTVTGYKIYLSQDSCIGKSVYEDEAFHVDGGARLLHESGLLPQRELTARPHLYALSP